MFVRFALNHKSSTHRRETGPDGPSSDGEYPSGAAFEARVRPRIAAAVAPVGRLDEARHGSRRRPPPRQRSPSSRSDRSESTPAKHSFVALPIVRSPTSRTAEQSSAAAPMGGCSWAKRGLQTPLSAVLGPPFVTLVRRSGLNRRERSCPWKQRTRT